MPVHDSPRVELRLHDCTAYVHKLWRVEMTNLRETTPGELSVGTCACAGSAKSSIALHAPHMLEHAIAQSGRSRCCVLVKHLVPLAVATANPALHKVLSDQDLWGKLNTGSLQQPVLQVHDDEQECAPALRVVTFLSVRCHVCLCLDFT